MLGNFAAAVSFTLLWEGGLADNKHDPGGLTKYGISQRQYPDVNIRGLTYEDARVIYRTDYWNKLRGDELPAAVAFALFDYAVNSGVPRASRALQFAVNVTDDAIIGPVTLGAVKLYLVGLLTERILHSRAEHYIRLVRSSPRFVPFTFGWERRLIACAVRAGGLV